MSKKTIVNKLPVQGLPKAMVKSMLGGYFKQIYKRIERSGPEQIQSQKKMLKRFVMRNRHTTLGIERELDKVRSYATFVKAMPIMTYEEHLPYFERISQGEEHLLFPGVPICFGKTSGTTGTPKYIPQTRQSINSHLNGAHSFGSAVMHYSGVDAFVDAKTLFFNDSYIFSNYGPYQAGAISSIISARKPKWLNMFGLPSNEIQLEADFDRKIHRMAEEAMEHKVSVVVAMPPYFLAFLKKYEELAGIKFGLHQPDFKFLMSSGMAYEPFKHALEEACGKPFEVWQSYPATEGHFGYQDTPGEPGMKLNTRSGMFFEFILAGDDIKNPKKRIPLWEVKKGEHYQMVISTYSGLWAFPMGDIVEFTSVNPYRFVVVGRISQIISPFGDHLHQWHVEKAVSEMIEDEQAPIVDFMVEASFPEQKLPHYTWYLEVADEAHENGERALTGDEIAAILHDKIQVLNCNYKDLVDLKAIQPTKAVIVPAGTLEHLRFDNVKRGFQQKVQRFWKGPESIEKAIADLGK